MSICDIFICDNISKNDAGHLTFGGLDTTLLAAKHKTPLYLMDENKIRSNCRIYTDAFKKYFKEGSLVLYAGKANAFKYIYNIIADENMGVDLVSPGEIYTAKAAGYNMDNAFFHSNNKTADDIAFAMDCGVGYFVMGNVEEGLAVEAEAAKRGIVQKALLRITPGIDPHTYEAVATGKVDSKFGLAIETGQAEECTALALQQSHVKVCGFHCHVGSEVFAEDVFERSSVVMLEFMANMKKKFGCDATILDLGGGYGVRYVHSDPYVDIDAKIKSVSKTIKETCSRLYFEEPIIMMEPGRSIVADAGMTLYEVGMIKNIPGYKTYVSIDGGMSDNPRYALYGARYTCLNASRMNEDCNMNVSIVGRCCESGDIIQENVKVPETTCRGDIIAVCTTGAYNYSMASNYNRIGRPPIVMLKDGEDKVVVRRETFEDMIALDL
ncbi:MAG: diaminopimelate decarboxylase [Lachnospiraceae bacterium]|nr:diaminopimelate decarboxylase [Lachnospiraceae bacterium]